MSATSVKLLQAAAEILGGNDALAQRLGVEDWLLAAYLADRRELPDALLLRAVDMVIADRQAQIRKPDLPGVTHVTENGDRGSGPATATAAGGGPA